MFLFLIYPPLRNSGFIKIFSSEPKLPNYLENFQAQIQGQMQKKVISRAKFKTVCDVHLYNFSDKVKLFTDKINTSNNESITEERDFKV